MTLGRLSIFCSRGTPPLPGRQGQNLVLAVLYVPYSLDCGGELREQNRVDAAAHGCPRHPPRGLTVLRVPIRLDCLTCPIFARLRGQLRPPEQNRVDAAAHGCSRHPPRGGPPRGGRTWPHPSPTPRSRRLPHPSRPEMRLCVKCAC